jgi:DNA-binding MarR family transcriptional regulator
MKLEEAILQSHFKSEAQKAGINIIYTANWLQNCMQDFLNPFRITHQQYNVLRILKGSHPISLSTCDIRRRMLDKMSDVSRIVDRLVKQGLVIRKVSLVDKRLVDVYISDTGISLLNRIEAEQNKLEEIMNACTQEELELLNQLLEKLHTSTVCNKQNNDTISPK